MGEGACTNAPIREILLLLLAYASLYAGSLNGPNLPWYLRPVLCLTVLAGTTGLGALSHRGLRVLQALIGLWHAKHSLTE